MSVSVGIDLVCVDEVAAAIEMHGERYLHRVYTDDEQRECACDPRRLAARFAAKEAMMKVLSPDGEALPWRSIGVRSAGGAPTLDLTGAAARLARTRGIDSLSLSLTHDGPHAAAVVIARAAA